MDDLKAIRTFLTVADLASFAAAARQMGTTPATVTRAVAGLEAALGVQLLLRTTRHVSLTSAGDAYARRVRPVLAAFDAIEAELRDSQGPLRGRIRLTAPMSFGVRVMPRILADFRRAQPDVEVAVVLTDAFVDILEADYDLAIRISGPPNDKSTIWRKLCLVERVLVAAPGAAEATATHPEELRPERLFAHSAAARDEDWRLSGEGGEARTLRAGAQLSANNADLLVQLLAAEDGAALLPRFAAGPALAAGELVEVLPGWTASPLWLTLYYPPYERLPPIVAAFSEFFERHITEIAPLDTVLDGTAVEADSR